VRERKRAPSCVPLVMGSGFFAGLGGCDMSEGEGKLVHVWLPVKRRSHRLWGSLGIPLRATTRTLPTSTIFVDDSDGVRVLDSGHTTFLLLDSPQLY
jgi:hypothetical protein